MPRLPPRSDQGDTKCPDPSYEAARGRRCAVYTRVSTDQQDVANQRPALESLARQRGWEFELFEEVASGAKERPVLDELCERARRGEFSTLVVWAVDRMGRSMLDVLNRVQALDAAGVAVVSFQEPWLDTSGPTRSLLLSIFTWVAQQERERLRERTRAGLARARKDGTRLGRPPTSPLALAAASALLADGLNLAEAAGRCGIGRSTLARFESQKRALGEVHDSYAG